MLLVALFLVTGLATYRGDSFPDGPLAFRFAQAGGLVGTAFALLCLDALGWAGCWLFPVLLTVWGLNRVFNRKWTAGLVPTVMSLTLAISIASMSAFFWNRPAGGAIGLWVAEGSRSLLGPVGSILFLGALVVLSIGFAAEHELMALIGFLRRGAEATVEGMEKAGEWAKETAGDIQRDITDSLAGHHDEHDKSGGRVAPPVHPVPIDDEPVSKKSLRKEKIEKVVTPAPLPRTAGGEIMRPDVGPRIMPTASSQLAMPGVVAAATPKGGHLTAPREPMADLSEITPKRIGPGAADLDFIGGTGDADLLPIELDDMEPIELPTNDLIEMPNVPPPPLNQAELLESSKTLVQTLADFGVTGRVGEVHPGPVITRFEFEPAAGIRIRIVAPIPGKAAVGIEIPNRSPAPVWLREIIDQPEFAAKATKGLQVPLGKDISGKLFLADLTKMPHLLVAGTTGSGKSVFVNSIISCLLLTKTPRELRLLMIDPKMLELPVYNGIPHLLQPVVTDPKQAARCLRGLITEMERRYGILARRGVRNIDLYNERLEEDRRDGCETIGESLPFIVAIIDELADLMITTANEVEEPIGRLAQTARAVGIHLVVATQRPSVDVLTGVIKANFPSRIAFQVASRTDSRTILDANGAESLLGKGDMLFMFSGRPELERVHGAYVSDRDTERLVKFWKRVRPNLPSIDLEAEEKNDVSGGLGDDVLFDDAARLVVLHQQGSASLLQRRLKVGYSRAARLVDMLEEAGIVAPSEGSKAREVLVDDLRLEEILGSRSGQTQPS
ncbi:MAG: DNA segregation ATPase FtsK/SpoIIIE, S-DNA-T family [bacterium]|nr:MAG: DNA segregation ATPase FtsK/SpoIIIE, S-DNA-T family [bacterium]